MYILRDVEEAENIYNMMPQKDIISSNSLIFMLKVVGTKKKSRQLINEIPKNDIVSRCLLIVRYEQHEYYEEAIDLFIKMHANGMTIDEFVAEAVLVCCTDVAGLEDVVDMGKLIHGLVMKIGIVSDVELESSLIHVYSERGEILSAQRLQGCWLDQGSWNLMIRDYGECNLVGKVRALFESMPKKDQ